MSPRFEPAIGRYLHLDLLGKPHRLYVEEAGSGVPLLCLHTAGSDGRQYRGLLNDARITRNFRVIVFDMPWHGKSSPPLPPRPTELRSVPLSSPSSAICPSVTVAEAIRSAVIGEVQEPYGATFWSYIVLLLFVGQPNTY